MRQKTSFRFRVELIAGMTSLVMAAVTWLWPRWIEAVLALSPDAGNGETEWALTGGLLLVAAILFIRLASSGAAWRLRANA
jgi:hypothetical protein